MKREDKVGSLKEEIEKIFEASLKATLPEEHLFVAHPKKEFGDYK